MKWSLCAAALLTALLCAGCGDAPLPETDAPVPESAAETVPSQPAPQPPALPEGDSVLLSLEAEVDGGMALRLDAIGKQDSENELWGVREMQVYHGDTLVQTLSLQEAMEADGTDGIAPGYTACWEPEQVMQTVDMDFDGSEDLALFRLDPQQYHPLLLLALGRGSFAEYHYAFTLQGAEADPETETTSSQYKYANGINYTDHYRYREDGSLELFRRWSRELGPGLPLTEVYVLQDGQLLLEDPYEKGAAFEADGAALLRG